MTFLVRITYIHLGEQSQAACQGGWASGEPHVCVKACPISLWAQKCEVLLTHRAMATMSQDPGGLYLLAIRNQPPAPVNSPSLIFAQPAQVLLLPMGLAQEKD